VNAVAIGEVIGQQSNKQVLDGAELGPKISQQFVSTWERDLLKASSHFALLPKS